MKRKALEGLRVLDLTRVYAGPFCSMLLADMGAEVLKFENPAGGDDTRRIGPYREGEVGEEKSGYYLMINRNKLGLTLNLKHPKARDIFLELVKISDVVMENFAPGGLDKYGLGWETLNSTNPRLILCSVSGYGQTGPLSRRAAYDGNAQATSGLMSVVGHPDGPPTRVNPAIGDSCASLNAAFGIMCAVYAREHTGRGQWVDVAQLDSVFSIMESAAVAYAMTGRVFTRVGSIHQDVCVYDVLKCADGYFFLGAYKPNHWIRLCQLIGKKEWIDDPITEDMQRRRSRYHSLIKPELERWASHYRAAELEEMFAAENIPCSKVNDVAEAIDHPQLRAREMMVEVDHPVLGRVEIPGIPCKLSDTPGGVERPAPLLGQHTAEVLKKYLRLSDEEIEKLREEGVI